MHISYSEPSSGGLSRVNMIQMNKKGLQLKSAFFAIIVLSLMIIAVGEIIGSWGDQYDSGITYDLEEDFNKLDEVSGEATSAKDTFSSDDPDAGSGDFESKTFRAGYGFLGRIFKPFVVVFNMLDSVNERFGLPNYVIQAIISMMIFAIVMTIIAIVFRRDKT